MTRTVRRPRATGRAQAPTAAAAGWSERQELYLRTLERVFHIKDAHGRPAPYRPMKYQREFHAASYLAEPGAPHRIVNKGRGMGYTMMAVMDQLMVLKRYPGVKIPVASIGGDQADVAIEWAIWLCEHAAGAPTCQACQTRGYACTAEHGVFGHDPNITSELRLDNGSRLIAIPGNRPKAIRSHRAPAALFDEFAHNDHQDDLLSGGREVVSEGGQLTILSTPFGTANLFWRLFSNAHELGFRSFTTPLFEPAELLDPSVDLRTQVDAGRVHLVAPWRNLDDLEKSRRTDPHLFLQEAQGKPVDEAYSWLAWDLIVQCHDDALPILDLGELRARGRHNAFHLGDDFASAADGDYAPFCLWEDVGGSYVQRAIWLLRGSDTPSQNRLLRDIHEAVELSSVTLDKTGPGTGLHEYASNELGSIVDGVDFGSKLVLESGEKASAKKSIATNLRTLMLDHKVRYLGAHEHSALQRRHLHAVRADKLDAPRSRKEGHADLFWANGLALWGARSHMRHRFMGGTMR